MKQRNLIIYRASAGSGKTYTLVREYLKLLLEPENSTSATWNRNRYQEILVATFTNKATTELRERIIRELHRIKEEGSSQMLTELLAPYHTEQRERIRLTLQRRAGEMIEQILFNYSFFRVQTIDSFFQEIVRGFVFELANEHAGSRIDLNTQEAVEVALDNTLAGLAESDPLFRWLQELYMSTLEEQGRGYSTRGIAKLAGDILFTKEMAPVLQSEEYTLERIQEQDKHLQLFQDETLELVRTYQKKLLEALEGDLDLARETSHSALYTCITIDPKVQLDKILKQGQKVLDGRVWKLLESDGLKAFGKSKKALQAKLAGKEQLVRLLLEYQDAIDQRREGYANSIILQEKLQMVPFLQTLKRRLDEYQKEHHILLIDEVNGIIQELNSTVEAPVMYEKVGTRISNYLIDEFQDTSSKQWDNFKPLLTEALSGEEESGDNYIVGDVKQSIYRWREADSSLLSEVVPREMREELGDEKRVVEETLGTNWRSRPEVIRFNNAFFSEIDHSVLQAEEGGQAPEPDVRPIYQKDLVIQKVPPERKPGGYIEIEALITSKKSAQEEEEGEGKTLEEQIKEKLQSIITQALQDGYKPSDIAILGRENKDARNVAEMLNALAEEARQADEQYDGRYSFLSDEALLVSNSLLVQFVIQYFRYRAYPSQREQEDLLDLMIDRLEWELPQGTLSVSTADFRQALKALPYRSLSLYELVRLLLLHIEIPSYEEIYINALLDLVLEYGEHHIGTLALFVEWWDEYGTKKCLEMGEGTEERIQLITIHKAKGLEFPIVIIPYASWPIVKNRSTSTEVLQREEIQQEGSKSHPPYLLDYYLIPEKHRYDEESSFALLYEKFWKQAYLDNLNLLYVAFTRASERLYVLPALEPPKDKGKSKADTKMATHVGEIIQSRLLEEPFRINILEEPHRYTQGEPMKNEAQDQDHRTSPTPLTLQVHALSLLAESIEKISITPYTSPEMAYGTELHRLLAQCHSLAEIRAGIQKLEQHGILTPQQCQHLLASLEGCLRQYPSIVEGWFASSEEYRLLHPELQERLLLSEQPLYDPATGRCLRPDRIILDEYSSGRKALTLIDYKFGEAQEHKYHAQIKRYLEALRGYYTEAKAYLWYNLKQIEQVEQVEQIEQVENS